MANLDKKDLGQHHHKIQRTQELNPADHGQRRVFCNWILQRNDNNFCNKMIFSEEANFHLNDYVNKQNCGIKILSKSTESQSS